MFCSRSVSPDQDSSLNIMSKKNLSRAVEISLPASSTFPLFKREMQFPSPGFRLLPENAGSWRAVGP